MSLANVAKQLESAIVSGWANPPPYIFDNTPAVDYSTAGRPLLADGDKDFVVFSFGPYDSRLVTLAPQCLRVWGTLYATIYIKEDTGTRKGYALADELNALLVYNTFSGIRVKGFSVTGGYDLIPGWASVTCSWDFITEFQLT